MENLNSKEPDWLTFYKEQATKAHQLRQENDHLRAKELFEEALARIQDEKQKGTEDERLVRCEATLNFAILDCLILLQPTPSVTMNSLHKCGDLLKEMMIDFSKTDARFSQVPALFADDFTATEIEKLNGVLVGFDGILAASGAAKLSPEQNAKLGMFYFFLSAFYENAQLFFGFSTMMIQEGEECMKKFRETATRTIEIFDRMDDEFLKKNNLEKYKEHVNKWFHIYADIMEATYALYVKDQVFDTNWAYQQKDVDMLWDNTSIKEETNDKARRQTDQNAAAQAMELLLDVYTTEALMNVSNYDKAVTRLDTVLKKAEKLEHPTKVMFYNHLKRAIMVRKFLLQIYYDEILFLKQMETAISPLSGRAKLMEYEDTDIAFGIESSLISDFDDEETTHALQYADRRAILSIPDDDEVAVIDMVKDLLPTEVYEYSERRAKHFKRNEEFKKWEQRFRASLAQDLEIAKMYIPDDAKNENHVSQKWLAILEARQLLHEYFDSKKENRGSKKPDSTDRIQSKVLDVLDESQPLARLMRIEKLLLKYTKTPKSAYFRQIAEIYIILAWVNIEKIELLKHKLPKEKNIDLAKQPFVCFKKARGYLFKAYNILEDLGDNLEIMHLEIIRAYSRLKFIKDVDAERESATLPPIEPEAREFRKGSWDRAFCGILRSEKLADTRNHKKALISEFEKIAKEFVEHIVSANVFIDNSGLPIGTFVKNDYAEQGMYKTVIKVAGYKKLALGIQSELPIPEDTLKLLPQFAMHLFNLLNIHRLKQKLATIKVEKLKKPVKDDILYLAVDIVEDLLPKDVKKENERMYNMFYSKLVEGYNLGNYYTIDEEFADYIFKLHDVGMAAIDSYFLNKPADLLPFEKIQLKKHVPAGVEVLRGILGSDDFDDFITAAEIHHEHEGQDWDFKNTTEMEDRTLFLFAILRMSDNLKTITSQIKEGEDQKSIINTYLDEEAENEFSKKFVDFVRRNVFTETKSKSGGGTDRDTYTFWDIEI